MKPYSRYLCALMLLLAAVAISVCYFAANQVHLRQTAAAVSSALPSPPVVLLDPGHGGMDGGAVSSNGLVEKEINLEISLILRDLFWANGFEVVMTRQTDCSIGDPGLSTIREQKVSDMHRRLALMGEWENGIFLSIHQNLFSQSQYYGAQVFYSPNLESSALLAHSLQTALRENLNPDNNRKEKPAGKELYLLYHAKIPAVLVECGFLSNPGEEQLLRTPEYQGKVAFAIFTGVMEAYQAQQEQDKKLE